MEYSRMELTHARLLVDDYAGTYEQYVDAVGLNPTFGDAESGYADLDTGTATLALFDRAELVDAIGTGREDDVMLVYAADSVDGTYERLQSVGVEAVATPTDRPEWGIRTAQFRDANGVLFEVNEPIETAGDASQ